MIDSLSIPATRVTVLRRHPDPDVLITMTGVMLPEDLWDPDHVAEAETTSAFTRRQADPDTTRPRVAPS